MKFVMDHQTKDGANWYLNVIHSTVIRTSTSAPCCSTTGDKRKLADQLIDRAEHYSAAQAIDNCIQSTGDSCC